MAMTMHLRNGQFGILRLQFGSTHARGVDCLLCSFPFTGFAQSPIFIPSLAPHPTPPQPLTHTLIPLRRPVLAMLHWHGHFPKHVWLALAVISSRRMVCQLPFSALTLTAF